MQSVRVHVCCEEGRLLLRHAIQRRMRREKCGRGIGPRIAPCWGWQSGRGHDGPRPDNLDLFTFTCYNTAANTEVRNPPILADAESLQGTTVMLPQNSIKRTILLQFLDDKIV